MKSVNFYSKLSLDEYVFCTDCADYAYEYCSIHGPLLVVPDTRVPSSKDNDSPPLSRAARSLPNAFLHLARSTIPSAGIGVFTTLTLPSNVQFGPYRGLTAQEANSDYCWQIYAKNNRPSHVVDASDANEANWMRYVNCSRHWSEQNLVAYQYRGQLYYRTIKTIPRFTELLVYYGSEFANNLCVDIKGYNKNSFTSIVPSIEPTTNSKIEYEKSTECKFPEASNNNIKVLNENVSSCESYNNDDNQRHSIEHLKHMLNKNVTMSNINKRTDEPNKVSCDICGKVLSSKRTLGDHLKIHSSVKIFSCDVCPYKCTQRRYLIQHIKIHTDEKTFSCDICPFKCTQKSYLIKHLKIHTVEKVFSCDMCPFKCIQRRYLLRHTKTHTVEKAFSCDKCPFRCTQRRNLIRHTRTHIVEKAFSCDKCHFRCTQRRNLISHTKTHTVEKAFSCDMCPFKCILRRYLIKHVRIHTREGPISCSMCSYKCQRKSDLTSHFKIHTVM